MGDDRQVEADALKDIDDLALLGHAAALAPHRDDTDEDDTDTDTDDDEDDAEAEDADDEYWKLIHELRRRGTQLIFDEAARMTMSEGPRARGVACDVLGQLGYKEKYPFSAETIALLARVCTEETSPAVLDSAISAMGHLGRPEALPFVIARATHPDPDVRFSVACALPSITGGEWLDPTHPAVTTLMQLTSDDDSDVRDWATFGLGTQVKVDGAAVRQCLLARLDDPDDDTRAEAMVGLARRRAPEVVRHVRDALSAQTVGRLTVESACALGDPSFAERLAQLADCWDVNVDLLKDAQRRCGPTRIDDEVALMRVLIDAPALHHLTINISSELLTMRAGDPDVDVSVVGDEIEVGYDLEDLMQRAGGSVDAAVTLIQHDLDEPNPIRDPPAA
jgi:HEAT repeats